MKYIKLALISFVLLFLLMVVITAFIPSQVRISRAININGKTASIHPYIHDLQRWSSWNEFVSDSALKDPEFSEHMINDGGFRITRLTSSNNNILTQWDRNGKQVQAGFNLIDGGNDIAVVQFYFDIKLKWYPWEKISSIVFDKQLGPLMDKSLENLKIEIEKQD